MTLRRITPIPYPGLTVPDLGPRPVVEWVSPTDLYVDGTYQRDLSKRSMELIPKMMREFAWNRLKLPIVVRTDGNLHVIDGQHTAIVAATLSVPEIPIFIVAAPTLDERARAFVGHNTDRIAVAPLDIYRALVASGDPDAVTVDQVCARAKIRLRQINQSTAVTEGDTMAVGTVRALVKKHGSLVGRQVLEVLVKAKRMPIIAAEIKAVEHVVTSSHRGIDLERLARIIRVEGDSGLMSAQSHAKIGRIPVWRALTERWRGRIKNAGGQAA